MVQACENCLWVVHLRSPNVFVQVYVLLAKGYGVVFYMHFYRTNVNKMIKVASNCPRPAKEHLFQQNGTPIHTESLIKAWLNIEYAQR